MTIVELKLIAALFQQLPDSGSWTKNQRDRWLNAVEKSVDLIIDCKPTPTEGFMDDFMDDSTALTAFPIRGTHKPTEGEGT